MERTITVRYVRPEDRTFWYSLDRHLPVERFPEKVRAQEAYILLEDGIPRGILRYHLFWENTPFCDLLYIEPGFQRRGLGRALMAHWEEDMRGRGYGMLMTSTQADEEAQHFYRAIGFRDCGGFVLPVPGKAEPMELIFARPLDGPREPQCMRNMLL